MFSFHILAMVLNEQFSNLVGFKVTNSCCLNEHICQYCVCVCVCVSGEAYTLCFSGNAVNVVLCVILDSLSCCAARSQLFFFLSHFPFLCFCSVIRIVRMTKLRMNECASFVVTWIAVGRLFRQFTVWEQNGLISDRCNLALFWLSSLQHHFVFHCCLLVSFFFFFFFFFLSTVS